MNSSASSLGVKQITDNYDSSNFGINFDELLNIYNEMHQEVVRKPAPVRLWRQRPKKDAICREDIISNTIQLTSGSYGRGAHHGCFQFPEQK